MNDGLNIFLKSRWDSEYMNFYKLLRKEVKYYKLNSYEKGAMFGSKNSSTCSKMTDFTT